MGGPMALNLLKAGHSLVVSDVRREVAEPQLAQGARWANSAAEAAQGAELILTSLPGPKQVEEVTLGEAASCRAQLAARSTPICRPARPP